jgi:hypothetical protein
VPPLAGAELRPVATRAAPADERNGTPMAGAFSGDQEKQKAQVGNPFLTWAFAIERATRIELA